LRTRSAQTVDNRAPVCTATNASCMISAIPPSGSVPGHRRRSHRLEPAGPARRKSLSRSSYQHPSSVSGGGVPLGGNSRTNIPRLQVWLCVSRPYPQHGSRYGGLLCMLPRAVPRRHSPGRGRIAHNGVGHTVSLPGRSWRDRTVPKPHRPQSTCEGLPVGAIIVAHHVDSAITNPSLSSSPWMRGAPDKPSRLGHSQVIYTNNARSLPRRWRGARLRAKGRHRPVRGRQPRAVQQGSEGCESSPLRYPPRPHRKSGQARDEDYSYRFSPLREPTPSEPSSAGAVDGAGSSVDPAAGIAAAAAVSFTDSRNVADGTKNRAPVTARLKSSSRS
jgi:hypothetical protein